MAIGGCYRYTHAFPFGGAKMRFVSKMSLVLLVGKVAAKRFIPPIARFVKGSAEFVTFAMFVLSAIAAYQGDMVAVKAMTTLGLVAFMIWAMIDNITLSIQNVRLREELARHTRLDANKRPPNVIPFPTKGGDLNA